MSLAAGNGEPLELLWPRSPPTPRPHPPKKTESKNKQYEAIREERRGSLSSLSESINSAFYLRDVLEANPNSPPTPSTPPPPTPRFFQRIVAGQRLGRSKGPPEVGLAQM